VANRDARLILALNPPELAKKLDREIRSSKLIADGKQIIVTTVYRIAAALYINNDCRTTTSRCARERTFFRLGMVGRETALAFWNVSSTVTETETPRRYIDSDT
jgi:hypothetical protein